MKFPSRKHNRALVIPAGDEPRDRRIAADLKISYAFGVTFLAVLSIAIYVMIDDMIDGQQGYSKIINVAGRQRMLSQRVALLATDLKSGDAPSRQPLLESLELMERSQNALVHGDDLGVPQGLSKSAHRFYFEGEEPLDPLVRKFIAAGRRFVSGPDAASAFDELQTMARERTLPALNEAVSIFEKEAENRLGWLRTAQHTAIGAILFTLALETIFVFLPMFRKVRQYIDRLRQRDAEMEVLLSKSRETTASLQMAEQIGHFGHWRITLPDYQVTWSEEIYRIHGVSPANFKPELSSATAFYHPEDRGRVERAIEKAIAEKSSFEFNSRLLREDGELRHVQCRGVVNLKPDGAVAALFGVLLDVTEQHDVEAALRAANRKLDAFAHIDAMTEIANRRKFDEEMDRAWRLAARLGDVLSVAMIDVDHFKAYNDFYGHQAGDECLRAVAQAIDAVAKRPGDVVARYGGEEFVMLLPSTDAAGALLLAERALAAVKDIAIEHLKTRTGSGVVSVSIGVASAEPGAPGTATGKEGLIAEADAMLYEAKRTGRSRVVSRSTIKTQAGVPLPLDEDARLAALASYENAGATQRSPELDRIARMAATLMDAPIALVSIVGADEQKFAGNFGLESLQSTGKDVSFCAHTLLHDDAMVVHDATKDPRFENNALVTGDLGVRYYAGAPIVSKSTGHHLGALCIIDKSTRQSTSPLQRALIGELANMAASLIEDKANANVEAHAVYRAA